MAEKIRIRRRREPRQPTDGLEERALRSLAQYRPFDRGGASIEMVHDDLLRAACQTNDGGFANLEAGRLFIKDLWKIELELDEVRDARERLIEAGVAEKVGGGLALSEDHRTEMERVRGEWEEAEHKALAEWEIALRSEYPFLSDEGLAELRGQLRPWIEEVICRHGAEASLLLYPGNERAERLIGSLPDADLSFLPKASREIAGIRAAAFRMFIRQPTEMQLAYLARLFNTGFYQTVLSLDPRARHLAAAEAQKTVLYLDTNFLYAVLGVGSQIEAHTASRLLELCRELGYSLRVTPWTVAELRTSIASSRADVGKVHKSVKSARLMAEVSGEKGFAAAYWRALRDRGTDPADFFGKFDHFQRFLEENEIHEHPEHCAEIDADIEAIRAYASPLEAMYGVGVKNRNVIEHDAKQRLLIERLRGEEPATYTDARYWFLTESTTLPTYGRVPIRGGARPRFPFCILTSNWAQIVRSIVPRTEDLDEVIVGLLASPYVGYKPAVSGENREAVERVAARIDELGDVPAGVAVALVNDNSIAATIAAETDETEVNRIIEESLTKKAAELEARVSETAEEAVAAQRERDEERKRAERAVRARTDSEGERDKARQLAADAREGHEAAERLATQEREAKAGLERDLDATRRREREERIRAETAERRSRHWRNGLASGLAAVVTIAVAALLATETVSDESAVIALIVGAVLCVYGVLSLLSASLGKALAGGVAVAAAVVTILSALWAHHDGGSNGDETQKEQPSSSQSASEE
jgi:hypothetical protein